MASQNFLQAFAPFARQPSPQTSNVLQALLGEGPIAGAGASPDDIAAATSGMPSPTVRAPRERLSLLDAIGRASDVIANVGGAPAQYQPYLDQREDRRLAMEDRDRQIDLDELRQRTGQQQLEMGDLQMEGARNDLEGTERGRIGAALGGIIGAEDPAAAWATVAAQSGIDPAKAEAIGQAISQNPEIVGSLATSFGFEPPRQSSQAKEMQIYATMQAQDPELAQTYLRSLANPDSMTPYQQAQLALAMEKFGFEKYRFENPQPTAAERTATAKAGDAMAQQQELASSGQTIIDDLRSAFERLRDAGGMNAAGQSGEQRVGAAIFENVPGVERITNPEGFSAREDIKRLRTVGIPSLLPLMGGLTLGGRNMDAAKELDTWQRAIASASDYESAIRALDMIEGRIKQIQARPAPAPSRPAPRGAPAPRQTHNRTALDNEATTEQGYRYTPGPGGRRNRANWQKVG